MKEMGLLGTYGFYEAADFIPVRVSAGKKCEIVRCWLAHHQGMSLIAVANVLCNSSSQRRFHAEPLAAATERLLHEKAPRMTTVEATPELDGAPVATSQQRESDQENLLGAAKLTTAA